MQQMGAEHGEEQLAANGEELTVNLQEVSQGEEKPDSKTLLKQTDLRFQEERVNCHKFAYEQVAGYTPSTKQRVHCSSQSVRNERTRERDTIKISEGGESRSKHDITAQLCSLVVNVWR